MSQFKTAATNETEAQFRQWLASLYAGEGVVSGLTVSQTATASGSVLVAAGVAVELGSTLEGARPLVSNAQETLNVLGANPMGALPRNDIVVFDSATVAAGTGGLRVIVGTPNASPTDPAVPSTAVPLARLSHAASATTVPTSAITSLITQTSLAGVAQDTRVVKSSTQTVNNSTTLVNDTELSFPVEAGNMYIFDLTLFASASGGSSLSDIKIGFGIPGGSISFGAVGPDPAITGGTTGSGQFDAQVGAVAATTTFGLAGSANVTIRISGSYNCPTSGTVYLRWAQASAVAVDTTIKAGSTLTAMLV